MDAELKQRNRRRKRAQRMAQAQREMTKDGDSGEDESPVREKPQRPPNRRKKSKDPLVEEDIVDGFAILGFKSYEDLELVLKLAAKENVRRLVDLERPKHETIRPHLAHHISAHHTHGLTLSQDPATSDDSGRASERLTGSSVAPRDADSSRDRLSDASSRCSSGKGYICDSEGEDDKIPRNQEEWAEVANEFYSLWQMPNTMGAIDGKQIAISAPKEAGSVYYNYKGFNSIDGGVFAQSSFYRTLENNSLHVPPWCLVVRNQCHMS